MRITRTYYDLSGTLDGDLTQLTPEAKAKFLDVRLAHTVEYEVSECGAATPVMFDGVPLVSAGELKLAQADSIESWFKELQASGSDVQGLSHESGWTLMATETVERLRADWVAARDVLRAMPVAVRDLINSHVVAVLTKCEGPTTDELLRWNDRVNAELAK